MRILMPLHNLAAWPGGMDLTRTIVGALRAAPQGPLDLQFALPERHDGTPPSSGELARQVAELTAGHAVVRCGGDGRSLMRAAVDIGAQVIFPTMTPVRGSHVRKVGYIFDFQHLDLPHLFPPEECDRRSQTFLDLAEKSDAMFCTSEFVARGIVLGLGFPQARVLVLPFLPHADPSWWEGDIDAARATHGIGPRYLMVCNHFWVHKDHDTALRAFAAARAIDPTLQLVLTGGTQDFRDPQHHDRLLALMDELGIRAHCHVLGLIPKPEQTALLRGAIAMLQPTRYEGSQGGLSTFQATGLGVPVLLSDIEVNREAQAPTIRHFPVGDAEALAQLIIAELQSPCVRPHRDQLEAEARARFADAGQRIVAFLRQLGSATA